MDRIDARSGFMPGVFGKLKKKTSMTNSGGTTLNPGPRQVILKNVPRKVKDELLAAAGEFVGTFMFLFLAFAGTQVANTPETSTGSTSTTIPQGPNPSQLLYIALCFGFSLAVNAWIFFRITGGLFNPAVTLGLCLIGAVPFSRGAVVFFAQILGGMAASGVVLALFPGPMAVTTSLGGGTNVAQGLFIEMFLTAQLVFTIFMLAAEKHKSTFLAPIGIGLSLFIAELGGVYYTGGSLNPARSFGPCVANRSFPSEHWIYWVGPILGALVASGFFWFIKSAEYETVNPGQDFDDLEAGAFDPEKDITRPVVMPTHEAEPMSTRFSAQTDEKMDDLMAGKQPRIPSSPREYPDQHEQSSFHDRGDQHQHQHSTFQDPVDQHGHASFHDRTTAAPTSHVRSHSGSYAHVRPDTGSTSTRPLSSDRTGNSFTIEGPPQIPMPKMY